MLARTSDRVNIAVPVQIVLKNSPLCEPIPAQAVDASVYGARLAGIAEQVTVGQILTVLHNGKKCNFRVAWVGASGTPEEHHVGLECLERNKDFWGINFQDNSPIFGLDDVEAFFSFPWEKTRAC